MSVIHAIILGILQGITEFLPVSSFGHLCAVQHLMGGTRGSGVLFEVMLHIGTMAALILFLWKDIRKIGIELIGMILDLIGNANIFLYNRRTGKNLTYARIVTGTYRKLTALLVVSTITAGMLMSSEYFTANFRLIPQKRPALIVSPSLDMPGNTETP